jgi:hypothetical protein
MMFRTGVFILLASIGSVEGGIHAMEFRGAESHVAAPIPAFARLYRTACTTCHVAAPKLNGLGEAFRLSGYTLSTHPLLQVQEDSVSLGAEPWKDLWPQGIWPSKIPGTVPLALRIQTDLTFTDDGEARRTDFDFPHEFYLLAAVAFDQGLSTFFEGEWSEEEGFEVEQARLMVQDVIPGLPDRAMNLWVGKQDLFLFTFAHPQVDRAARQQFSWQKYSPSDVVLTGGSGALEYEAASEFELGDSYAAVEVNGLVGPRLHYGVGVSQGVSEGGKDLNSRKDGYYRLRYKLGGLPLDGQLGGAAPPERLGGQMRERALILEHFGYFGGEANPDDGDDAHRSFGVSARGLLGRWDAGVGWVRTRTEGAWEGLPESAVIAQSLFGKVEWSVFPWFFLSGKGDWFKLAKLEGAPLGVSLPDEDEIIRLIPGFYALLRQNVRLVGEADFRLSDTHPPGNSRPWGLYLRLDLAF